MLSARSAARARAVPLPRPVAALLPLAALLCLTAFAPAPADGGQAAGGQAVRPEGLPAGADRAVGAPQPAGQLPPVVPRPVSMTAGQGQFRLGPRTRIVVAADSPAATPVAWALARYLRPATGWKFPVVTGQAGDGDIGLALGSLSGLQPSPDREGYQLGVSAHGVTLAAVTPHGLYNGVQTLRQLLPPWIASSTRQPGPWPVPAVHITDYPRYAYRGVMLDIARHYQSPAAVERLIGQLAAYKINVLHLHLSDDQGFRIAIDGFPRLAAIGGQGSVGTGGRSMDPGGYWTQADYQAVVRDAATHFMTVVPEVDTPGHTNAIIMSEYGDVSNPLLDGHPQDINCGSVNPPQWDYSRDVGYSALCPGSGNTWTIVKTIIRQLAALSPGPYYHVGGDEVPTALLSQQQYAAFINREASLVQARHKIVMGWADIARPGTDLTAPSVAEYWQPASGSSPGTITAQEAVAKGMKLVMAPASHAYLDQKYLAGTAGNVPPTLGLSWACPSGCDVSDAYNWDPGGFVTGVTDRDVIGIEGALWGETVVTLRDVDYLAFPRVLALAEVGWSPAADRTLDSPAYRDFRQRLAAQGGRLMAAGVNFYPSTQVPWRLQVTAADAHASPAGAVNGQLAELAAPGFWPAAVTAMIAWGDGTSSQATVTGAGPTPVTINSLYALSASHSYAQPGLYHATVTVTAPGAAAASAAFTVSYPG